MPATSAATRMIAEDLPTLQDDGKRYELVRGKLNRMSASSLWSSIVSRSIGIRVGSFVEQHGLGLVSDADGGFFLASAPDVVRAPAAGRVVMGWT